jgi:hypothetical protein
VGNNPKSAVMPEPGDGPIAAANLSFEAARHGNFGGFDALLPRLAGSGAPADQAWAFALCAIRWSFDPRGIPAPTPEEARRLAESAVRIGEDVGGIVARACAVMERAAWCTFDRPRLSAWLDVHATLAAKTTNEAAEDVALSTARLSERLLAGETAGLDAAARALIQEAARSNAGGEVIETTVVRALIALSDGALQDAIDLARRASRMAQSEALSQQEYLANMTLARVRRYSGRPHLALHILAALRRVAPPIWSGWIGWETLLAGGKIPPANGDTSPDGVAVPSTIAERRLSELLAAARDGDRAAFPATSATLERAAGVWPHLAQEVAALLAALDPLGQTIPESMSAWCRGETAAIPYGLHGVGIPQDAEPQTETATAYVIAQPGVPSRRFLSPGLPLAPQARMFARDSVKSGARTETAIAALALAGAAGDTRDRFFRSVYGFPFVAHRHRAVLDVLIHRMRRQLGSAGELHRDGSDAAAGATSVDAPANAGAGPSMTLVLHEAIVVPDMRCVLPTADRVLRALATLGATSASAAADCLRMPLRTVQAILQQLVAEGACTIERDGRRVAYRIEDTTFTEVTSL